MRVNVPWLADPRFVLEPDFDGFPPGAVREMLDRTEHRINRLDDFSQRASLSGWW
jgi:hypothetical protein